MFVKILTKNARFQMRRRPAVFFARGRSAEGYLRTAGRPTLRQENGEAEELRIEGVDSFVPAVAKILNPAKTA